MKPALEYLIEDRGIDEAIAQYAAWREEGDAYVIPYFDAQGRERSYRLHRPGGAPKYKSLPNSKGHLYCVENVRYAQVVICEGEIDTLSALSAGLKSVGTGGANAFYRPWKHLLDHTDDLVIAYDGDKAGKEAAVKLKSVLPHARIITPPEGKDLNDILRSDGPEAIRELIL